jgi:hypothetical protein
VRHVIFAVCVGLYVVTIGQTWAIHSAALMVALWVRHRGELASVPFTIGRPCRSIGGKSPNGDQRHLTITP